MEKGKRLQGKSRIKPQTARRNAPAGRSVKHWREGPEGRTPLQRKKGSLRGAVSRRLMERLPQICCNLSVSAFRRATSPLEGEAFGRAHTQKGGRSCGLLFVKDVFKREMNYLEMS